ncbi:YdcF family protein [Gordonia sp. NPDC003425]
MADGPSVETPDIGAADSSGAGAGRTRRRRRWRRILISVVLVLVLIVATYWGLGYQLFYREHQDSLRHVDAIVVLGGEHDGREDYGLTLAREGYARTVVVSNPYLGEQYNTQAANSLMQRVCGSSTSTVEVICFAPDPSTTRGEAMYVEQLARKRNWHSVIVISWRFHMVRARYIFGQCFSGDVVMRSVPRDYPKSIEYWGFQFAYQYGGLTKAAVLGCDA